MGVIRETVELYRGKTLEDFMDLPEGTPAQLIDGEIVTSPSPTTTHQRIAWKLGAALRRFVTARDLGEVLGAPLDVHLSDEHVFQPDLLYVSHANREIVRDWIYGSPDLVVEILSPSTGYYDLTKKRDAYARFGVKEYWIVDPGRRRVEVLGLEGEEYRTDQVLTGEGVARSVLLDGFEMEIAPLFELPGRSW